MKPEDIKDPRDRKHAEREERRNRVRTYKERPIQKRDQIFVPENRNPKP